MIAVNIKKGKILMYCFLNLLPSKVKCVVFIFRFSQKIDNESRCMFDILSVSYLQGSDLRMVEEVADFLVNMVQKRAKKLLGKQMVPNITSNHSFVVNVSFQPISFLPTFFESPE